jgi:hypothetical protein
MPIYHNSGEEVYKLSHFFKVIQLLSVFIVPCEDMVAEILQHTGCLATPELVRVKQLTAGLECFGYKDLEFPRSRRHLDFSSLELRSIRVLNRLIADKVIAGMQTQLSQLKRDQKHLETSKELVETLVLQTAEALFEQVIRQAKVKIVGKPRLEQIGVIESQSFFA